MTGVRAAAARAFGALVRARERAYERGRLGVARLPAPVISIGNLSVGGSGKTPTVIALGRALRARGVPFDVLTRGYRRQARELAVARRGDEDVRAVGDEPLLIARELQAPVIVCRDRFRGGLEGERRFGSRLHLLDDGFQHRQLARQCDLVLVSAADLNDRLLPAGRLREPPAALGRATALLWLNGASAAPGSGCEAERARAEAALRPFSAAPVFPVRKRPLPLAAEAGPVFAFCGLARPDSFWATLDELGVAVAGRRAFRDHHRYGGADLRGLERAAHRAGARGFVTTAKDALKLPAGFGPVQVVEIEMEIAGLDALVRLAWEACGL